MLKVPNGKNEQGTLKMHLFKRAYRIMDGTGQPWRNERIPYSPFYGLSFIVLSLVSARLIIKYRSIASESKTFALVGKEATSIVHDINNSLSSIIGFEELIRESVDDEELKKYCDMLRNSAEKIQGLAAEIKIFTQEKGTFYIARKPSDPESIIRKVANELHCSTILHIHNSLTAPVSIDKIYFERMVWHLLKNAQDVLKGRPAPSIDITMNVHEGRVMIRIADNGPGMDDHLRKSIFKCGCISGGKKNDGMGLCIVKRIVDAHKGYIRFEHRPCGGTVFFITLPEQYP